MPVYRDADGNIIEEKSKQTDMNRKPLPPAPTRRGKATETGGTDRPTASSFQEAPDGEPKAVGAGRLEKPTMRIGKQAEKHGHPDHEAVSLDEHTRVYAVRRRQGRPRQPEPPRKADAADDPVVGWLAIVDGPGKGRALQLGYGSNAVGRGKTARVQLDFGDDQISRGGHAVVTYDPRGRKYYVQHGGGKNLTYLNDKPVLTPTELPAHGQISIGETVLRFVPLCGDAFDWQDTDDSNEHG